MIFPTFDCALEKANSSQAISQKQIRGTEWKTEKHCRMFVVIWLSGYKSRRWRKLVCQNLILGLAYCLAETYLESTELILKNGTSSLHRCAASFNAPWNLSLTFAEALIPTFVVLFLQNTNPVSCLWVQFSLVSLYTLRLHTLSSFSPGRQGGCINMTTTGISIRHNCHRKSSELNNSPASESSSGIGLATRSPGLHVVHPYF